MSEKDEDEDVSSCWMPLKTREYRKLKVKDRTLWREIALEEAMDLSYDRLRNEYRGKML